MIRPPSMACRLLTGKTQPVFAASLIPRLGTRRSFRSDAALDAIEKALEERVPNVVLYNYPSFSGAYSALFVHLYHARLSLPCLVLPFSSFVPFRAEDLCAEGFERFYILDFIGPKGFVSELCRKTAAEIICFDHRKSALSRICAEEWDTRCVKTSVDTEKSSSKAVYDYFSSKLTDRGLTSLLETEDRSGVETVLDYIEDMDLRRWSLPDVKAFSVGIKEWLSRINCITNPYMFEQLLKISPTDLITCGNSYLSSRQLAASRLLELNKIFKVRLGRGFYGECLGMRADGSHHLSDELGKLLSLQSAAAGLRPIGAVTFMQRNNLKMCLRSTENKTDTSEVAKAYGGGGSPSSSSFMIRMDEYNQWVSTD
ncbi:PREDICTED: uncharacterized protein LOC104819324 [Tarenaya hassleriana]|uniref:uncharacterized protein LOC104819324 n=1 Tax=Tarenaya hassleriana TaxID=28532 RepID=UPI00053C10A7|nr:PREDICTED: uncharacterized protein LOC104819324 [Tarenaya hassleriana]